MNVETADETPTPRKKWWKLWWVWALLAMIPLLPLIVVSSMIGIVAKGGAGNGPAVAVAKAQMQNLSVALVSYRAMGGNYPTQAQGLQALVTKPTTPPIPAKWSTLLDTLPLDPWGHPYVYRIPSTNPAAAYDLVSLGPDGVPSADDVVVSAP